jgi:hypothetical protein
MATTTAQTVHDSQCEQLPGGEYHNRTIGNPPMLIPCHCEARTAGRARATRANARAAAAATRAEILSRMAAAK